MQKLMDDEPVQDDRVDCLTRGKHSPWWITVRETLLVPADEKLTQILSNTPGVPCPTCGVYFLDRPSMLVHMAKNLKMTHVGHVISRLSLIKPGMPKMDCISVGTVTRRCVTGSVCASIVRRNDFPYSLPPLHMSSLLHQVLWVPMRPHQHSMLRQRPCRNCHMLRGHMSSAQCVGMETMLPFIYQTEACSPTTVPSPKPGSMSGTAISRP